MKIKEAIETTAMILSSLERDKLPISLSQEEIEILLKGRIIDISDRGKYYENCYICYENSQFFIKHYNDEINSH
jgi:hypothetical protein